MQKEQFYDFNLRRDKINNEAAITVSVIRKGFVRIPGLR